MTKREKRTSIRVRSNALLFPPRMPELPHLFLCLLARIAQLPRHILTDILFRTHQTFGQRVPLLRGQHLVKPTFRLTIWKAVLEIWASQQNGSPKRTLRMLVQMGIQNNFAAWAASILARSRPFRHSRRWRVCYINLFDGIFRNVSRGMHRKTWSHQIRSESIDRSNLCSVPLCQRLNWRCLEFLRGEQVFH